MGRCPMSFNRWGEAEECNESIADLIGRLSCLCERKELEMNLERLKKLFGRLSVDVVEKKTASQLVGIFSKLIKLLNVCFKETVGKETLISDVLRAVIIMSYVRYDDLVDIPIEKKDLFIRDMASIIDYFG